MKKHSVKVSQVCAGREEEEKEVQQNSEKRRRHLGWEGGRW